MNTNPDDPTQVLQRVYEALRDRQDPPVPWSHPSEVPWTQEQFSRDYARAAARDPETSAIELEHIVASTGISVSPTAREAWKILDLGCGSGRLLLPLARMGHRGFGIDLGPAPVEEMLERAAQHGLAIEGVVGDLRDWSSGKIELSDHGSYDLALISFGTLGALRREEGESLLGQCARAMRPGAWLHLDLGLSVGYAQELDGCQEWWTTEDFVLGEGPQLVLDDHSYDAESQVYVRRSFALGLEDPPRLGEVRQTSRLYEGRELGELLENCGFEVLEEDGDFLGTPYDPDSSENLVVAARRVE